MTKDIDDKITDMDEQMVSLISDLAKTEYPKVIKRIETYIIEGEFSKENKNKSIAFLMFYRGYLHGSIYNMKSYMKQLVKVSDNINKIADEIKNRLIRNILKK